MILLIFRYTKYQPTCNMHSNALQTFERGMEFAESTPHLYLFLSFLIASIITTNTWHISAACFAAYAFGCFPSCSFWYMSSIFLSKIGICVYSIFVWMDVKLLIALSCVLLSIFRLHNCKVALVCFAFCLLTNFICSAAIGTYEKASLNGRHAHRIAVFCMMEMSQ